MKISINTKQYNIDVTKELTILQACELINIHIPRFCYHDKLSIAGNCRMCFVELPKAKKPALACSTAIHDGIELFTNTFVVKKAQESVLEFLLINHPLDCPICDQAGECDLQELTKNFGSDRGRFGELKRSVEDLELGSVVKTIMTRCIHCTRCIRFASEVLTIPSLGTSGRGRDTEVSMYINNILHSELSGNIVDLCPVGALTSKPYAFRARPWELSHVESIDVLDSLGSSLRLDLKGNQVMRILPRINDDLNEEWITDKVRYSYDSYSLQRLTSPSISIEGKKYLNVSWKFALQYLTNYLIYFKKNSDINIKTGNLIDLGSSITTRLLANSLETKSINSSSNQLDTRSDYLLSCDLNKMQDKEAYFIVGSNMDYESPILKLRIQKNKKKKQLFILGPYWNSMIPNSIHAGVNLNNLIRILEGRSPMLFNIYNLDSIELLYRNHNSLGGDIGFTTLMEQLKLLINNSKSKYLHSYLNTVGLSNVSTHTGFLHSREFNLMSDLMSNNIYTSSNSISKQINYNILTHNDNYIPDHLNHDNDSKENDFNIYLGNHKPSDSIASNYNIVLPTDTHIESKQIHLNNLGLLRTTNQAIGSPGKSKSLNGITLRLLKLLTNSKYYTYSKKLLALYRDTSLLYDACSSFHGSFKANSFNYSLYRNNISKSIYYFHCADPITFNSPIMVKLIKEKKSLESTFYNNLTYTI